jgi:UDP-glucose 4-epimerase
MAKAVVTGGAGFIGSHICDLLHEKGYQVSIIDDLSTGKRANITQLLGQHNVEFIHGNITDRNLLMKAFKGADYVFHEAAIPSVPRSIENPVAANEANVTGTLSVP